MNDKMILLCGIPSEGPIAKANEALLKKGAHVVVFNQRQYADTQVEWSFVNGKPSGLLHTHNCSYQLDNFKSVYTRFMSEMDIPEVKNTDEKNIKSCRSLHESLYQWLEVTDSNVVNRHSLMFSNSSKPYQAQIIRLFGLKTPPTVITNNPEVALAFYNKHKSVIYKSISGVRSIVKEFDPSDLERLAKIKYCPVQFQKKLGGFDVRVHVIGKKTVATKIVSTEVDYRYVSKTKGETILEPFEIPDYVKRSCIQINAALGLSFTGIDLRFTDEGVYCFEVNPMPGYSYYESNTGQGISTLLAEYLINAE